MLIISPELKRRAQWIMDNNLVTGVKSCYSCQHFIEPELDGGELLGKCEKAIEDRLDDDIYFTPMYSCKHYIVSSKYGKQDPQEGMMEWINRVNSQMKEETE